MPPARGTRCAIIGAGGSVGAAVSYALLLRPVCAELLLVDVDRAKCAGECLDLQDACFLGNARVRQATLADAAQCDLIVVTAGAKQRQGETRLQLVDRNLAILRAVLRELRAGALRQDAVLLLVANPVDVLTYFAQRWSGLPAGQVLGTGTFLDTARLRYAIASRLNIAYTAVHAYVLGEHGDSQFPCWSSAHIGGVPLLDYPGLGGRAVLDPMAEQTKKKAYDIIAAKGATYFGIGSVVASIAECIFLDQKHIRPLSVYHEELGVCISAPCVLGRGGVQQVIQVPMDADERRRWLDSAASLRQVIQGHKEEEDDSSAGSAPAK